MALWHQYLGDNQWLRNKLSNMAAMTYLSGHQRNMWLSRVASGRRNAASKATAGWLNLWPGLHRENGDSMAINRRRKL